MEDEKGYKEKLSAEKVWEKLKAKGVNITMERANEVVTILRMFADIVVTAYLEKKEKVSTHYQETKGYAKNVRQKLTRWKEKK